jgi:FkbM family methyltransferase
MINKKPNEQQNIVIRILKKLEIIKIILGIKNTFKVFSQINNWKTFHPTKENMIITNFTLENRKYEIVTNKYDLRSYLIKDGKQNHKIFFLKKFLKKGYFFDIGTNYGEFSLVLSEYQKKVFCFEPNFINYECLKETFKNFNNVSLFDDAVSNQIGRQKMPIKLMSSGSSSLNSNTNIENKIYSMNDFGNSFNVSKEINLVKLSNFFLNSIPIEENIINIKIDVEGHENNILEDLLTFKDLEKKSFFIIFEYNIPTLENLNNTKIILKKFFEKKFKFIIIPQWKSDMKNFEYKYTNFKDINFKKSSEICITNYNVF